MICSAIVARSSGTAFAVVVVVDVVVAFAVAAPMAPVGIRGRLAVFSEIESPISCASRHYRNHGEEHLTL